MLPPFAQKVLNIMEPDASRHREWTASLPLYEPSQAEAMKSFQKRIQKAVEKKEKVFVAGDFDADGILATSILVDGLKSLGLETGFYIPDRIREGYGLSAQTVDLVYNKGYSLIITVDNGVKAKAALARAEQLNLEVIVSDHHHYEDEPQASLLLHPRVLEEHFSTLCGAALAFEMLRVLHAAKEKHLRWAAVASIGDCMEVTGQTRRIIRQGLASFVQKGDPHLSALSSRAVLNETDVSFQIVPKFNAIGRLSNMANVNTAVRFMLSDNPVVIADYAAKVEKLNEYRKDLTNRQSLLASSGISPYKPILISADPAYHEGIIGILAGKLCQGYKKPAIVASIRDGICKASMRAPKGFNILEFMKGYENFEAFGGHSEAAGFSVAEENWKDFEAWCLNRMKTWKWESPKRVEIEVSPDEITLENVRALDALRPFGPGFECPDFVLEKPQIVNTFDMSKGRHRKFTLKNGIQCLNFNQSTSDVKRLRDPISRMIGSLQTSEFQGRTSANFIINDIIYEI